MNICGINPPFGRLSLTLGQVTNVLLTRLPLLKEYLRTLDLHVLGTSLALNLSHDQTLLMRITKYNG